MKTTATIYVLIDPFTFKVRYVGQTSVAINKRLLSHCTDVQRCHRTHWISSLKSKGSRPIIEQVEIVPFEKRDEAEKQWIDSLKRFGFNLVNGTNGGSGTPGFVATEAFRKRMSQVHKGRAKSEEHKRRIGEAHRGMKRSEETKKKISEKAKGRIMSEATKQLLSRAGKGRKLTPEQYALIAEKNRGAKRSESCKEKLRLAWKKRKQKQQDSLCTLWPISTRS